MNAADIVAALDLPNGSHVDQRVPKKVLQEHAPTSSDKRRITEVVDELRWVAALKPTTVGVPLFRDDAREYLEIALLTATLRDSAKIGRILEVIHRAIPYPLVLVTEQRESVSLSLAHKRWSQAETRATVLDGDLIVVTIPVEERHPAIQAFCSSLALIQQPQTNLFVLYQGWVDVLAALLACRTTGVFAIATSPERALARREALRECVRLDAEIIRLRAAAAKEHQIARQVELNVELKRTERIRAAAAERL